MKITIVAAIAKNYAIGINNKMPWHLPADLRRFKQLTMGKPILMGRKTYESIGKVLPGRKNIVVTRKKDLKVEGINFARSFEEALSIARPADEVIVIGGAQIYELALPLADNLLITWINANFEADTYFPDLDLEEWKLKYCEPHDADASNPYNFELCEYERR